jgi:fatty-acyl-CoA synthase
VAAAVRAAAAAAATQAAFDDDGWFRTGDAAYRDDQGFLFICDRVKDMIISGGENVYPAEVESGLMRHPAIAEVAVIGAPDEKWGEAVVAIVVPKPGQTVTLDELRGFAGEFLARYKLPSRLETVAALPRNATGKILKYELRQTFARSHGTAAKSARQVKTPTSYFCGRLEDQEWTRKLSLF